MAVFFGWNTLPQILGLIAGVVAFMASATVIHLTHLFNRLMTSPRGGRAFQIGKRIRLIHAIAVVPALVSALLGSSSVLPGGFIVTLPDVYAGLIANLIVECSGLRIDHSGGETLGPMPLFLQACLATFVEGWLLAGAMAVLCFLIWCALRASWALRATSKAP